MLCQDVMKKNVECLSLQDTLQTAARKMREGNMGFLPVCDGGQKAIGTVTDRDIAIRAVADGKPPSTPVQQVMTDHVISCSPRDDLKKAQQLMAQHHKSRILCVENGRIMGVISLSDIAQRDGAGSVQTMAQITQRESRA